MRNITQIILVVFAVGHVAHAAPRHASVDVAIAITNDSDPSRKANAETIRRALTDAFTTVDAAAPRIHFNVSVTKLGVETVRGYVEVCAELHVVISDDRGKMLSYVTGGSKVQVPSHSFKVRQLPKLEQEAIEDAIDGMLGRLRAHVRVSG
jgi:hypothetical protein